MTLLLVLAACTRCPDGFAAKGGACEPTGTLTGTPQPITEEDFPDRYEDKLCDELEDCFCESFDLETCDDVDLDCPNVTAPTGCVFDPVAADDCLHDRYECDENSDVVTVTAPESCERVWDCSGTASTGDTGAR